MEEITSDFVGQTRNAMSIVIYTEWIALHTAYGSRVIRTAKFNVISCTVHQNRYYMLSAQRYLSSNISWHANFNIIMHCAIVWSMFVFLFFVFFGQFNSIFYRFFLSLPMHWKAKNWQTKLKFDFFSVSLADR